MKIYLFILLFLTNIRGLLINPRNLNYLKYPKSFKNRIVKMDYEPFKNYKEILTVLPNFQTNIIINNWIEYINLANSSDLDYEKKAIYDFKVYLAMHKDQYNNLLLAWTPDIQLIERPVVYLIMGKSDLLPRDKNKPIGKQKIKQKNETIKVKDKPPQAPVSTHSNASSLPSSISSS